MIWYALFVLLLTAGSALAQQPSCEDQLRTVKVALDQVQASRARGETDAAQVISKLIRQIESLHNQVQQLTKPKE